MLQLSHAARPCAAGRAAAVLATMVCASNVGFGQAPANDSCATPTVAVPGSPLIGTTEGATPDGGFSCPNFEGGTPDVWFAFQPTTTSAYALTPTPGSTGAPDRLAVYVGNCGSLAAELCGYGPSAFYSPTWHAVAGTTYLIRVAAYLATSFSLDLTAVSAPSNDLCAGAIPLADGINPAPGSGASGDAFSNVGASTGSAFLPCASGSQTYGNRDVWFSYVATTSGVMSMRTCATAGTTTTLTTAALFVYDGTCGLPGGVACSAFGCPGDAGAAVQFFATSGTAYLVRVGTSVSDDATGQGTFRINVVPPSPPPPNDACENAWPLAIGANVGTLGGSQHETWPLCAFQAYGDVWYSYAPTSDVVLTFTSADVEVETYVGGCAAPTYLACPGIPVGLAAGGAYLFRVFAQTVAAYGPFSLDVSLAPLVADECATAVPAVLGPNVGTFAGVTASSAPICYPNFGWEDAWFSFLPPFTGVLQAQADGPAIGQLSFLSGPCAAPTNLACGVASCAAPVVAGAPVFVRVRRDPTAAYGPFSFGLALVPPPSNDVCAAAATAALGAVAGTLAGASSESAPVCGAPAGFVDVWYRFTPSVSTAHRFATPPGDVRQIAVHADDCASPAPLFCAPPVDANAPAVATLPLVAGVPVRVRASGPYPFSPSSFTLTVSEVPPPPNDEPANATPIGTGTIPLDFGGATVTQPQPCTYGATPPTAPDLWFSFVAPADGTLIVSPGAHAVYAADGPLTTPLVCGFPLFGTEVPLSGGQHVLIQSSEYSGATSLTVQFGLAPRNDECAFTFDLVDGVNPQSPSAANGLYFTTTGAAPSAGFATVGPANPFYPYLPGGCTTASSADVFFRYVATESGAVTISLRRPPGYTLPGPNSFSPAERRLLLEAFASSPCGGDVAPVLCHADPVDGPYVQVPVVVGTEVFVRVAELSPALGGPSANAFYATVRKGGVVFDATRPGCGGGGAVVSPVLYGSPPFAGAAMTLATAGFAPQSSGAVFLSLCGAPPTDLSAAGVGCVVHLDLVSLIALGGFVSDAGGRAAVSGFVPDAAALLALPPALCAQAVAFGPTGLALTQPLAIHFGP